MNIKYLGEPRMKNYQQNINEKNNNMYNWWSATKICSKLTKKTPERHNWRRSGDFIVNFEHILHLVLVFLFQL